VPVQSQENGRIPVAANTITSFVTEPQGVLRITPPDAGTLGGDDETDTQLRNRYFAIISQSALGSLAAVQSAVRVVDGVTNVLVFENDSSVNRRTIEGVSTSPRTVVVFVEGGIDAAVARAIFNSKPLVTSTAGSTRIEVDGTDIQFQRIATQTVTVSLAIQTTTGRETFPSNGSALLTTAISEFINALEPGEEIDDARLRAAILSAASGFNITTLTTNAPTTVNASRRLVTTAASITITVSTS